MFSQESDYTTLSRNLWTLKQGQKSFSEFVFDFRIKFQPAVSGWNVSVLKSTFFQALIDSHKHKLSTIG